MEPTPAEPKERPPGFARAAATSSASAAWPEAGLTTSTSGTRTTSERCARSRYTSKGMRCGRAGAMDKAPGPVKARVWPSEAAFAAASVPMTPPAPVRLSTTTGWPSCAAKASAKTRPKMSAGPPAAKGTTRRSGRFGAQRAGAPEADCAKARCPAPSASRAAPRRACLYNVRRRIRVSSDC